MTDLKNKVAIVTGASSGIGRATAELLAERGAAVVLAARRADELDQLSAAIVAKGGVASSIQTDVADAGDVERMVAHAISTHGRLDIAVNNAGTEGVLAPITEISDSDWDVALLTNLRGCFLCMKHEARAMIASGNGGSIVNIGSVNSFLGFGGGSSYVASKHGQVGLTTSASAELAPQGVRVNIVCPGLVKTPMHERGRAAMGDEVYNAMIAGRIHMRRAGRPDEIAKVIAFLCSEEASYVTGATLTPDGGFMTTI